MKQASFTKFFVGVALLACIMFFTFNGISLTINGVTTAGLWIASVAPTAKTINILVAIGMAVTALVTLGVAMKGANAYEPNTATKAGVRGMLLINTSVQVLVLVALMGFQASRVLSFAEGDQAVISSYMARTLGGLALAVVLAGCLTSIFAIFRMFVHGRGEEATDCFATLTVMFFGLLTVNSSSLALVNSVEPQHVLPSAALMGFAMVNWFLMIYGRFVLHDRLFAYKASYA